MINSRRRPADDTIARVLDWLGLTFGLGIIVFITTFTIRAI
ncbi:hypothetical protein [Microvirga alba]|nr:hypothetical protein [Microvirga alba]